MVGHSTSTTRRQLAMTTDRAAGSMIYRCGGPPGVALVRVVFTRRPYCYIQPTPPRLLLLRLLLLPRPRAACSRGHRSLPLSSLPHSRSLRLRLRRSHAAPLPPSHSPPLILSADSHRGKRLIVLRVCAVL